MITICCNTPLRTRQDNEDILVQECIECGTIIKRKKQKPENKTYQLVFFVELVGSVILLEKLCGDIRMYLDGYPEILNFVKFEFRKAK